MIDIIPAHPALLDFIDVQPQQVAACGPFTRDDLARAMQGGFAFAAVDGSRVLAIGGVYTAWEDRGVVWGLLSGSIRASMLPMHRAVSRGLALSSHRRIEAYIVDDHAEGHRWIKMLGFEREGCMRRFWRGRDYDLYAPVKG